MTVKLISYTQPTEQFAKQGIDDVQELIAFCARVSNPTNQFNTKTSDRLISYLIKHKHWSPLEMADAVLEIETTRDIGRQLLRHRSFVFQEFSQRYADPTDKNSSLSFVTREARLQDSKNRQNSITTDDAMLQLQWDKRQKEVIELCEENYRWAVDNGIAKEQARAVLPEGLTMSRLYVKGSIRSWIHYIEIRSDKETQKEHREIARACAQAISSIFPMINNFVDNNGEPQWQQPSVQSTPTTTEGSAKSNIHRQTSSKSNTLTTKGVFSSLKNILTRN